MAFVSEREIVRKIFSKKIDFTILAFLYISSIFFLLCSAFSLNILPLPSHKVIVMNAQ